MTGSTDATLRAVIEERDLLADRVTQLEALLRDPDWMAPPEFRLTQSETRVLDLLLRRRLVTKDGLMAALYGDEIDEQPDIKITDQFICKIRAKLKPFGITIHTRWGVGWYMIPSTQDRVRAMAAGEAA